MVTKKEAERPDVFTKDQVLSSKRYEDKKDAIRVILEDNKSYLLTEVKERMEKFMKGRVR